MASSPIAAYAAPTTPWKRRPPQLAASSASPCFARGSGGDRVLTRRNAASGRGFVGEKNYDALPVAFLGRPWEVMVQIVHGTIAAIAPYLVVPSRREAETVFTETFRFCGQRLGEPAERQSDFCVWQLAEATVVLPREAAVAGLRIGLVLTSIAALTSSACNHSGIRSARGERALLLLARAGSKGARRPRVKREMSTVRAAPSTINSATASPVAGALRMPHTL
jgi:hypothetical protein